MQKYRKNHMEMIAPSRSKADFKFLNTFADQKPRRLNVILLQVSNFIASFIADLLAFFSKSAFA